MTSGHGGRGRPDDAAALAREIAGTLAALATSSSVSPPGAPAAGVRTASGGPGDLGGPLEVLERASRFVTPWLPSEARMRIAKKLVLRAMRIVTRDQTTFNSAVLESLRIAYREIGSALPAVLEETRQQVAEAESRGLAAGVEARETLGREIASGQAALREEISKTHRALGEEIASVSGALREEIEAARGDLSGRIKASERDLRLAKGEWAALRARLTGRVAAGAQVTTGAPVSPGAELRAGLYAEFEETFRGSEDEILRRQVADVWRFASAPGPVADLGCGRGEFLEALRRRGIPAVGVESNPVFAARCREKGLAVEERDLFDFLSTRPDGSLGGISAFQVVEHLPQSALFDLVELAAARLAPGGPILLETVNPESAWAMKWFWSDLTHVRPVPGPTLAQLLRSAGFRDVEVDYRSPVPAEDTGGASSSSDPAVRRLAEVFFGPQDVAVHGVR